MSDLEKLIRFVLNHPELTDRLKEIALLIETQPPVPDYSGECA